MKTIWKLHLLLLFFLVLSTSQAQVTPEQIASISEGETLEISGQVMVKDAITISDKKNITISGSDNAEIVTFNSEPHVLKFLNCKNVKLENIKIRFGIENVGGAVIEIQESKILNY